MRVSQTRFFIAFSYWLKPANKLPTNLGLHSLIEMIIQMKLIYSNKNLKFSL